MVAVEPKGRTLERWVAECHHVWAAPGIRSCKWNDRTDPTKHRTAEAAVREAARHAIDAGHVGAMAVTVRRIWKPRELDREEIVGG